MNLPFFRDRLIRMLSRPPEVLYAFARHWVLLSVAVIGGTAIAWALAISSDPIYEGHAHLQVTQSTRVGPRLHGDDRLEPQPESFLHAQALILRSDDVIRRAVEKLGLQPEEIPLTGWKAVVYPRIRSVLRLAGLVRGDSPPDIQDVVESFQSRASVEVKPDSNTVEIVTRGPEKERLLRELESWTEAYREHMSDAARLRREMLLENRLGAYREIERSTREELQEFKQKHPKVSESQLSELTQRITQLETFYYDLWKEEQFARALGPTEKTLEVTGTDRATLLEQLRAELHKKIFLQQLPASSRIVQRLRQEIEELSGGAGSLRLPNAGVNPDGAEGDGGGGGSGDSDGDDGAAGDRGSGAEARGSGNGGASSGSGDSPARVASGAGPDGGGIQSGGDTSTTGASSSKPNAELAELESRIADLYLERHQIERQLDQLTALQESHDRALEQLRTMREFHTVDSREGMLVEVSEGPTVDPRSINLHPALTVLIGAGIGIVVGCLLAIVLELLCTRVRFKHDVLQEIGLPVTVVFSR